MKHKTVETNIQIDICWTHRFLGTNHISFLGLVLPFLRLKGDLHCGWVARGAHHIRRGCREECAPLARVSFTLHTRERSDILVGDKAPERAGPRAGLLQVVIILWGDAGDLGEL